MSQCSDTLLRNVYPDDITLVHQFLRRAKELCQNDKLEVVYSGTQEHLWRVLFTIRRLDESDTFKGGCMREGFQRSDILVFLRCTELKMKVIVCTATIQIEQ